jgi:hypothetical protein
MEEIIRGYLESAIAECSDAKLLAGDNLAKFCELFGIDSEDIGDIYYNKFNIIFTDKNTYDRLKYYMPQNDLFMMFESEEYNSSFYVMRYYNDYALKEALN